jgi:hypothetical protein
MAFGGSAAAGKDDVGVSGVTTDREALAWVTLLRQLLRRLRQQKAEREPARIHEQRDRRCRVR